MGFEFDADTAWGSIAFAVIGGLLFGSALRYLRVQRQSRNWPRVTGRVVDTRVDGNASDGYSVECRCTYDVDGKAFEYIERLDNTYPTELIARGHARDRQGAAVEVAYDPSSPADSTADPGDVSSAGIAGFITGGFLGFGLWLVWKWWGHAA